MDPLKSFIQENKELFEQEALPAGHYDIMMQRLQKKPVRLSLSLVQKISVAASILCLLGIGGYYMMNHSSMSPCANEPYTCYVVNMQEIERQLDVKMQEMPDYRRQEIMQNMDALMASAQSEDFLQSLPKELSNKEQKRLLTQYYSQLYEGVKEIAAMAYNVEYSE